MDKDMRRLLIEVAKTVLRVLEANTAATGDVPTPWSTTTNHEADKGQPTAPAPAAIKPIGQGDAVRFWNGDRYVVGNVVSVCRTLKGTLPPQVNVRVERPSGRGKNYKVATAKCERVKEAQ